MKTDATIEYFLKMENRKQYVFELIWITAFVNGLRLLIRVDAGPLTAGLFILVSTVVVVILRFLAPWLLMKSGMLFKGKANLDELKLIVSLSCVPTVIELGYLLLVVIVPGEQPVVFYPVYIVTLIFWLRILIKGVAKVQAIPATSAIVSIIIALLPAWILIAVIR